MKRTVEAMLAYFTQIRQVYAEELNKRFVGEKFSPNEISILILLSNNKTIHTASQMKLVLGVSKGLLSRSIDALTAKGLIECRRDEHDKRRQRVFLTEKADPLVRQMKEEIGKIDAELLEGISQEEINQMEETLTKILNRYRAKESE